MFSFSEPICLARYFDSLWICLSLLRARRAGVRPHERGLEYQSGKSAACLGLLSGMCPKDVRTPLDPTGRLTPC